MTRRWPSPHQGGNREFALWWRLMRRLISDADRRPEAWAQMITIEEAEHWTEILERGQA